MATAFQFTSSDVASIFDIFSEDSLRGSLKPAWDFLMRFLTQKYPNYFLKALKYTDEVYYVILFIIEEYNLRNKSASMTESFYELKRESTALPYSFTFRHAKTISLISLVLIPYIEEKLRNRYEKLKEKVVRGESSSLSSFDRFLHKWFPVIETLSKWIRMLNYVLYLFKYTGYALPLLKLTSFQLKYNTGDTQRHNPKDDLDQQQQRNLLRSLVTVPLDFVTSTVTRLAPLLFYSLSFLETFYQQDGESSLFSNDKGMQNVPPPGSPKVGILFSQ